MRAHVGLARLRNIAIDEARHALRHDSPILGGTYHGIKELRPGQRAVARVCCAQHRDRPGHAGRPPREHGIAVGERLAVRIEEHAGRRAMGRRLATVEGRDLLRRGVVIEHEAAAPDAGALWLDEPEHRLDRDGRIDRAAAGCEDFEAGFDGERVGRRDAGAACGRPSLGGRPDRRGRRFGLDGRRAGGDPCRRQECNEAHGRHSAIFRACLTAPAGV